MLNIPSFSSLMQPFAPFEANPVIAVAVSGGGDSMALALLASHWADALGGEAVALTVDHGLRPESATEARQVGQWLALLGVKHHVLVWEGRKRRSNIQAVAREKRYELLVDWCNTHQIKHLLTAHHLDDQAETVIMRLARGSGVDGLSGIPPISYVSGVRILRPLLGAAKAELLAFLSEQGQEWVEDPSNQSLQYKRSALRAALNSYADAALISKRLADTAHHMARVRDYLEIQTEKALESSVVWYKEGYATLNRQAFGLLHEEIGLRVLVKLLCRISGNHEKPRFRHLETLRYTINQGKTATLHGCKIAPGKQHETMCIYREFSAIVKQTAWMGTEALLWDGRFLLEPIRVNGKVVPLGSFSWSELYVHYSSLKQSPIPKAVLRTLPVWVGVEDAPLLPYIKKVEGNKKPAFEAYFHYSND